MDWGKVKIDYVTDASTSYRSLASRYGVSATQVANRAKAEGWRHLRERHLHEIETKTMNAISSQRVEQIVKIHDTSYALLNKLQEAVDQVDSTALVRNSKLARGLTGALRDIKELLDIKSDADMQEQAARIDKLHRDAQREESSGNDEIIVKLMDGADDYGK